MNWEIFGVIVEAVGGLAVIISLLYLAKQMRENRLLAIAESQRAVMSTYIEIQASFKNTPSSIADFRNGLNRYETLDPDSQARFTHLMWPFINHGEMVYEMHKTGLMGSMSCERFMAGLVGLITTEGGAKWWEIMRVMIGPEYVAALEHMRDTSELTYKITDLWHFYNSDSLDLK